MEPGFYQHPTALVETKSIGPGTRIWAFAHVLSGARIGSDCNICDHTFIENDVIVGDRVTIKCGVQLWDGIRVEDDVFIGPNTTFTNDPFPRSRQHLEKYPNTVVRRGASIGANSTILPGLTIGSCAMVGAGSVVTHDVPANAIVAGNPARITGYAGAKKGMYEMSVAPPPHLSSHRTGVRGATLHHLPLVEDMRGALSFGEISKQVPFEVKRYFVVFNVPGKDVRGEHAHRRLHQFLVCVHGSCHCVADDGASREEFVLNHPSIGLHIEPMCWTVQYKYTSDAVLLVLASEIYDSAEYIRDYAEFLAIRQG